MSEFVFCPITLKVLRKSVAVKLFQMVYFKLSKSTKITSFIIITVGTGWIVSKVRDSESILNNALDVKIIKDLVSKQRTTLSNNTESVQPLDLKPFGFREDSSLLQRLWHYVKFSYAKRLLALAKSDKQTIRLEAVKRLSRIKNLYDWQYSFLAQTCDSRTAVGLARSDNVDLRWFRQSPVHIFKCDSRTIEDETKDFLVALGDRSQHKCIPYFISKVFSDAHDPKYFDNQTDHPFESIKRLRLPNDLLPLCVETVQHHSSIPQYARDVLLLNGLPLLYEIHKRFSNNSDVRKVLAKIMLNVSVHAESLELFNRSGWLRILVEWSSDVDISISAPASCALSNLDSDRNCHGTYYRQLYLLHPVKRNEVRSDVDVILIHGLLGGVFFTWRQRDRKDMVARLIGKKPAHGDNLIDGKLSIKNEHSSVDSLEEIKEMKSNEWKSLGNDYEIVLHDIPIDANTSDDDFILSCYSKQQFTSTPDQEKYTQCWPCDWLTKDCKEINLRLLGINYETNLSRWTSMCPDERTKSTILERSRELTTKLLAAGVGERPIVWIVHSMGGLLVKNILIEAHESENKNLNDIVANTKGVVFFSTPHRGTPLAALSAPTALVLWPSIEVMELKPDSPLLIELNDRFLRMLDTFPMRIISFVEAKPTLVSPFKFNFNFVLGPSADIGVGEFYTVPQDHLGICKPASRHSFLYQKVLQLVKEAVNKPTIPKQT